jgi:hypothetical protein
MNTKWKFRFYFTPSYEWWFGWIHDDDNEIHYIGFLGFVFSWRRNNAIRNGRP